MELRLPSAISDSQMYCDIGINDFVRNGNISSQLMLPFIETVTLLKTIPKQIFLTFFHVDKFLFDTFSIVYCTNGYSI